MNPSIEIVNQLVSYFDAKIIGSQLFVGAGLLSPEDTRDIDIAVPSASTPITVFLTDRGFEARSIPVGQYDSSIKRIEYTHPDYDKTIDLNVIKGPIEVYPISKLIAEKFKRANPDDLKQIAMVVFNKGGNPLKSYKDLQEFYELNKPEENEPDPE